jgi:protein SCO1/2
MPATHDQGEAMDHGAHSGAPDTAVANPFARDTAMNTSQAAIGREPANYNFVDANSQPVQLHDYRGKPLVISLIYTSCYHICPTTTRHLLKNVKKAESALGADSFNVVTLGFDAANDSPDALRSFAGAQGVNRDNWDFLSADAATIEAFADALGFIYVPSSMGFDHLIQTTIIDAEGVIYRQVYGIEFDTPHLIEPLKELVFGEEPSESLLHQVSNRIRLFCTVYDPASDSYRFDYSIFVGLTLGLIMGGFFIYLWLREWRRTHRSVATTEPVRGESR